MQFIIECAGYSKSSSRLSFIQRLVNCLKFCRILVSQIIITRRVLEHILSVKDVILIIIG